mgnify:CR=1 FL=1
MSALNKYIFLSALFLFTANGWLSAQTNAILGMTGGMGITQLKYNSYDKSVYRFKQAYSSYSGISLEFPMHKIEDKGSFYNELAFFRFKTTASLHEIDSTSGNPENSYFDYNLEFAPNIVTLTHMFRYTFTPGDFKYFVSAGVYNNFVISSNNRKTIIHTRNAVQDTTYGDAIPDFAVHGLMITAGTGFIYKNIGFEIRFDPGRNFTRLYDYSIYAMSFTAQLHVRFNP